MSDQVIQRARNYLAKCEGAIEGQSGDAKTYWAATVLVNDFGLSIDEALAPLEEWNEKCVPKWSRDELIQKLENADRYAKYELGSKAKKRQNGTPHIAHNHQNKSATPLPLFRDLPPPAPFPLAALGETLRPVAEIILETVQAPDAICGQSLVAASALAVQGYADAINDGRKHPISTFHLSIAESGERKSAIDNLVLEPHRLYEKQQMKEYGELLSNYKNEMEVYERIRSKALNNGKKTKEEIASEMSALGAEPKVPINPILTVEEPTYEGIVKHLENGRPSVGIFSDEGGRMVGGHGMQTENQLKTAAGLSSLWDGKPITRSRASDGTIKLYGRRASLHLMQQGVALQFMGNPILQDQGMLSRCLASYPDSTSGTRFYKSVDLSKNEHMKFYQAKMIHILDTPLPIVDGSRNELNPRLLALSENAKRIWVGFYNDIEKELGDGGRYHVIRGFGSKIAEQAIRLAGVLALVEDIHRQNITHEFLDAGVMLAKYYLEEALRIYNPANIHPDLYKAQKLLAWCQSQPDCYVYSVKIYQCGPNAVRTKSEARKLIAILEEHGWLTSVAGGLHLDGSHRHDVWRVTK
jgi:hypothetical protein